MDSRWRVTACCGERMISLLSIEARPPPRAIRERALTGIRVWRPSSETSLARRIPPENFLPRSSGGAYANRPKLRGRKIQGRTPGCPLILVPQGNYREKGLRVPPIEGKAGIMSNRMQKSRQTVLTLSVYRCHAGTGSEQIVRHPGCQTLRRGSWSLRIADDGKRPSVAKIF